MKPTKTQRIAFKILIIVTITDAGFAIYNIFSNNLKDAILPIGYVLLSLGIIWNFYKENYSKK